MLKTEHINNLSPVAGNTAFTNVPYCKAAWGIQTSCHHQIMQNKNGYLQDLMSCLLLSGYSKLALS